MGGLLGALCHHGRGGVAGTMDGGQNRGVGLGWGGGGEGLGGVMLGGGGGELVVLCWGKGGVGGLGGIVWGGRGGGGGWLTGTPFVCAALIQPGGGMVTSAWLKYTNTSMLLHCVSLK